MKIITVLGARPQFIKAATVSRAISQVNNNGANVNEIIIHTGQHYDINMSQIFFEEMNIPSPKYNLNINGKGHSEMTGEMLTKIDEKVVQEKGDLILVYGDTNSTLAGGLVGAKQNIPVMHVEAGLRSFNRAMPEEVNRIVVDHLSSYLYSPSKISIQNLMNEGIADNDALGRRVFESGDVMYDALLYYSKKLNPTNSIKELVKNTSSFCIATLHRQENTDSKERLQEIIMALDELASKNTIIMPLHPRTKNKFKEYGIVLKHITLIDPVGYFDMLFLLKNCQGVFTDSGGLQKEAYFLEKFCITMREETEWKELVKANVNILVGSSHKKIIEAYSQLRTQKLNFKTKFYGDGQASVKIVESIING